MIPYRTSYYEEAWGFCLSHKQLLELEDQEFEVRIDSELKDGSLTYGEFLLEGDTQDEILLSAHVCHAFLANEIASETGVYVSQIHGREKRLLEGAPEIFSRRRDHEAAAQEAERDRLYRKFGRLQVEVDWLKKRPEHLG